MVVGQPHRLLISRFQVKVHHLLLNGATLGRNALVKQQLILDLGHCAALDGRGMGNDGIEIEFLIVYLVGNAQSLVLVEQAQQSFFLSHD